MKKSKKKKSEECKTCRGVGRILVRSTITIRCPLCYGTGKEATK